MRTSRRCRSRRLDQILAGDPLGGEDLLLCLDPTAASVAAAHWLHAAADVVAALSGIPVTQVVAESDNIEALPHATPTAVLELMESGLTPTAAVTGLVRDAMAVATARYQTLTIWPPESRWRKNSRTGMWRMSRWRVPRS